MNKIISVLFISIIIILLISGCEKESSIHVEEKPIKTIKVMTVKEENKPILLDYLGRISVLESQNISFSQGGTLKNIFVSVGDRVKKGDLLAALDESIILKDKELIESNYKKALASLEEAKKSYDFIKKDFFRKEKLYKEGALSKVGFDSIKFKLDQSEYAYNQSKNSLVGVKKQYEKIVKQIENFKVKSEISGVVTLATVSVGEKVNPINPIIKISSENKEVITGVVRKDLKKVRINDEVEIVYDDEIFKGHIYYISTKLDPKTRTYPIKIRLEEGTSDLIDESLVNVKFKVGEEKGIWIPLDIISAEIEDYVFIYNDGKAIKQKIEVIESDGIKAKVKGINKGDQLIIEGMSSLRTGDLVKLRKGNE